jgi:hypothetical protein
LKAFFVGDFKIQLRKSCQFLRNSSVYQYRMGAFVLFGVGCAAHLLSAADMLIDARFAAGVHVGVAVSVVILVGKYEFMQREIPPEAKERIHAQSAVAWLFNEREALARAASQSTASPPRFSRWSGDLLRS